MNRNDFYKQLMSEYSFDADKIKSNARKGKFAGHKALPMYIGMTAAAAVLVVTVGTTAFLALDKNHDATHGVVLSGSSDPVLSADERLTRALEDIRRNAESSEQKDVMVTFVQPLSPASAQAVLTAYSEGSVPVKRLYFEDGTSAADPEQVEQAFNGGERRIRGALVSCAGYVMASLNEDGNVFLVELVTGDNIDTIAPIDTAAVDNDIIPVPDDPTVPEYTAPVPDTESREPSVGTSEPTGVETAEAQTSESVPSAEPFETTAPESNETSDAPSAESSEPVITPEPPHTDVPPESTATEPDVTEPKPQPEKLPDGVNLPESAKKFSYETVNIGAKDAFFLDDSTLYVRTPYQIQLYTFNGVGEQLLTSADCQDAEICWISENGDSLIVSATDENGTRNRLLYVDAKGDSVTDLNAIDTIMEGTLKGVGYNADSRLMVMNILENGRYYICASRLNGKELEYVNTCFDSASPLTLMAAEGNKVYFAAGDGPLTQIYEVNAESGSARLIKTYENSPRISSNLAFTHGIIYPTSAAISGNVEIFDPHGSAFINAGSADLAVEFGTNKHSFSIGGSCYTVSGGAISPAGGIAVLGGIEYKKSASSLYEASAAAGKVRITESIYTAKAKSGALIFSELSDSVPADIRAAVNGAIGVNNAIALGICDKCGITSAGTLTDCVNVYYSANAADRLKNRCGISEIGGVLRYNGAGLTAINVHDTVLSVSANGNTASGMLYVRAGSFGGKTAYASYNISLVKENGSWKLDGIIGG